MSQRIRNWIFTRHILAFALIVGLVILLWLPFGLKSTVGGLEEWTILNRVQLGQNAFWTFSFHPTRPLNFTHYAVISALFPNDLFLVYNLFLFGIFIGKAIVVYLLLCQLVPQIPYVAFLTSLLFIIYPADDGLFSFRAVGVQLPILIGLLSICLVIQSWRRPLRWLWLLIWPLQLLCLLIYELMYPPLLLAPLLFLWLDRKLTRRFWRVTLFWTVIPGILFAWVIWNIVTAESGDTFTYIGRRLTEANSAGLTNIPAMLKRIPPLYGRHLSEWLYTINEAIARSPYLPLALVAGVLVALVGWLHLRRKNQKDDPKLAIILMGVGFIFILIGYLPFLPSPYVNTHWRMYMLSSLGAALFLAALVYWAAHRIPILAALIGGVLVALAAVYAFDQHSYFVDTSIYLQRMLAGIVQDAPRMDPQAVVVMFDDASITSDEWRMSGYDYALAGALTNIYDTPVRAIFCNHQTASDMIGDRICDLRTDGIFRKFAGTENLYPYEQVIAFHTLSDGTAELLPTLQGENDYHPDRLINRDAPLPVRVRSFFTCWPLENCFPSNTEPQERIRIDFDRMVRGIGWQRGAPSQRQLWMTALRSTIIVNPVTDRTLQIQFRLSQTMGQDILNSLRLEVNGQVVPIQQMSAESTIFRGVIPQSALHPETELAFSVNRGVGKYNLSVEFDWLTIESYQPADTTRIEFDRQFTGTGWESPAPDRSQLWTLDKRATMNLYLPTDKDLEIRFQIDLYLQQDIVDSLRLTVNGEPIALERIDLPTYTFRGIIPKSALRPETELVFMTDRVVSPASLGINQDSRGLGLLFDWLEIHPAP